jgi:hypothetical protein
MEARRYVEFTDVELAGGAELIALVEKVVAGSRGEGCVGVHALEKPGVGGRRGGDEGIWATVLWHKGDAG